MSQHYHVNRIVSSLDVETKKATTHINETTGRLQTIGASGRFCKLRADHTAKLYKGEVTRIGVASYLMTAGTLMVSYTTVICEDEPCQIGR